MLLVDICVTLQIAASDHECHLRRDLTRPAVIKHSGMIIEPIKFNKSAADNANQGKDRKMKVSVSSGIPRASRR